MSAARKRRERRRQEAAVAAVRDAALEDARAEVRQEVAALEERHRRERAADRESWIEEHNERVRLEARVAELEAEANELREAGESLEAELNHWIESKRRMDSRCASAEARVAELEAADRDSAKLRRRLASKSKKIDELRRELRQLQNRVAEARAVRVTAAIRRGAF